MPSGHIKVKKGVVINLIFPLSVTLLSVSSKSGKFAVEGMGELL